MAGSFSFKCTLLVLVALASGSVSAQVATDANTADLAPAQAIVETSSGSGATGTDSDRFSREWLAAHGLSFTATYRAEALGKLHGGLDNKFGGEYLGSIDTTLNFDLKKLSLGRGQIVVSSQNLHGRSIDQRKVGAVQAPSDLDEAKMTKVTELYYGDSYLGDRIAFRFGRLYADADFNTHEVGGDFMSSSYGLIPTVPMPTYPAPQFGGTLWIKPLSWLSFGAGVFEGDNLPSVEEGGAEIRKGVFTLAETKISPFRKTAAFHGVYRVGLWRQGEGAYLNTVNATAPPVSNYGVYATGDHWFRRPTSAGENVGPGVFFQVGWSPKDRNEVTRYYGGGMSWSGLISQRAHDSVGIGVTCAALSAVNRSETVTELFYKLQATKKVFIQPDLQFIAKPSGVNKNALVGGFRIGYEF